MTVGPRYIPGSVTDAAKISPPIAATRAGHDVSINVNLNAGVPVESIRSGSHGIEQINSSPSFAKISLKNEKVIPNKDFILRYDVTGKRIEDAVIAHRSARGGFFTMILQPPDIPAPEDRTPKEIVFVLDTSGSMYGFPIEKAKEAMKLSLDGLYPEDTFNLITFAGDTRVLFEEPVPATQANIETAQEFLDAHRGGGGTEMMKAIKAALDPSDSKEHVRIVCFMTDGYVGNENEIIAEIQRHPKARVFSFGIGSSVNRFLLDKMAEAGRGEVEYVALTDDGSRAAKRFYERVRTPMLTDISIDWNGMPVSDVYPSSPGDLFTAKPVVVTGRFAGGRKGSIKLKGNIAGQPYEREIAVTLPDAEPANDSLASLWARRRIDQLSSEALNSPKAAALNKQITDLGLEFRLMTQFTSFVAVEERIVNQNGQPVKVEVPIEIPGGVNINAAIGEQQEVVTVSGSQISNLPSNARSTSNLMVLKPGSATKARASKRGVGSGVGYGSGSGSGNGNGSAAAPPRAVSVGVISNSATVDVVSEPDGVPVKSKSISEMREAEIKERLHVWLYALARRSDVKASPVTEESRFVTAGKAKVKILFAKPPSPETLARLRKLGLDIESNDRTVVTGSIPIEKLTELALMGEVRLVLPKI
jgi:Ca-activated chloride channel family protein